MTIINREKFFIYLKSHKTAGTSTEFYLITQTNLGLDVYRTSKDIKKFGFPRKRRDRAFAFYKSQNNFSQFIKQCDGFGRVLRAGSSNERIKEHMSGDLVRELIGSKFFDQSTVVTNIRNPWDALVSSYKWKHQKDGNVSFPEYLERALKVKNNGLSFAQEYLFYPYLKGVGWRVSQVVVFEDLANSIDRLVSIFDARHPSFSQAGLYEKRMGGDRDYRAWYTDALAERVQNHFSCFLKCFPYEYDSPGQPPAGMLRTDQLVLN